MQDAQLIGLSGGNTIEFLSHPGSFGYVLHIELSKAPTIIYATSGEAYLRRGGQNKHFKGQDLIQLARNKGASSYETTLIRADPAMIMNSANIRTFLRHNAISLSDAESWLKNQQLVVDNQRSVSGILLFCDEPQALLPSSGIKITRYTTSTAGKGTRETLFGDPISIEGCAYHLIGTAVRQTQEIIEGVRKWTEHDPEMVSYPRETLHEIITNAVLHRDYSISNYIAVRIFDDRVEVESPGIIPGLITEQNILRERFPRNQQLNRLINKFPNPPNKELGEGMRTAFKAMEKMRLRRPEIRQSYASITIYISHSRLESAADTVMDYLANHPTITNEIGRELTSVRTPDAMKQVFVDLAKKNLIERVPETKGRNSAWQSKAATPAPVLQKPGEPPLF